MTSDPGPQPPDRPTYVALPAMTYEGPGHTVPAQHELRNHSGNVTITSRLVSFLYELMRDHLPPGKVEAIMQSSLEWPGPDPVPTVYVNGWLAEYARSCADRLGAPWHGDPSGAAQLQIQKELAAKHQVPVFSQEDLDSMRTEIAKARRSAREQTLVAGDEVLELPPEEDHGPPSPQKPSGLPVDWPDVAQYRLNNPNWWLRESWWGHRHRENYHAAVRWVELKSHATDYGANAAEDYWRGFPKDEQQIMHDILLRAGNSPAILPTVGG